MSTRPADPAVLRTSARPGIPPDTLLLVPPEPACAFAPETKVLGLPHIRRTALAARRAGFERVLVLDPSPAVTAALAGSSAELVPRDTPTPAGAARLQWNVAVHPKDLEALRAGTQTVGVPVCSPRDLPRAERFLLRGLIKPTEGFMSRHFDRKISLAISRRLAGTSVTPNQMTILSVAIGVFGALFFLSDRPLFQTLGALTFVLHSIVDGCDGELARLRFQESRGGGLLDYWGDNLVHLAVFGCIAIGWSRAIGVAWPLALGASAILGTVASSVFVYRTTMTGRREGPLFTSVVRFSDSALSRAADALSRRDFIYLVLILSAFGKASWFLVLAAVGAPIFFLALVGIALRESHESSPS
jgi:phosphatidylglycerophosphate synthase